MVKHEDESHIWGAIGILLCCLFGGSMWLLIMNRFAGVGNIDNDPIMRRYNKQFGKRGKTD